jgi:hypothetical protein
MVEFGSLSPRGCGRSWQRMQTKRIGRYARKARNGDDGASVGFLVGLAALAIGSRASTGRERAWLPQLKSRRSFLGRRAGSGWRGSGTVLNRGRTRAWRSARPSPEGVTRMSRLLLGAVAAVIIILTGCSKTLWIIPPGGSEQQLLRDSYECRRDAATPTPAPRPASPASTGFVHQPRHMTLGLQNRHRGDRTGRGLALVA